MNIKEFLKKPEIQQLLENNDLDAVYNICSSTYRSELSDFLIGLEINPIDYFSQIPSYAFDSCDNFTSITIPAAITSIGSHAFSFCKTLTSIQIPNTVTSIGDGAFKYCTSLTSITIPDSVTSIGSFAFEYCTSLKSITIPNSVISIGNSAFGNCDNLEIVCNKYSYIHKYAIEYNIPVKLLNESLNESLEEKDTLIEDITDTAHEEQRIIDDIRKLLTEQGFEEEKKLNGLAFTQELNKPVQLIAQFYVDTTDLSHSSYIKSDDENFINNYSTKGEKDSLQKSAALFVNEFIQVTTADII